MQKIKQNEKIVDHDLIISGVLMEEVRFNHPKPIVGVCQCGKLVDRNKWHWIVDKKVLCNRCSKWKQLDTPAFNIIAGLWGRKNGLSAKHPLDMTHKREMVIVDLDYFIEHHKHILSMAEAMVEKRDKDRNLQCKK